MSDLIFLTAMTCTVGLLLAWGFKHLPGERWQMLAATPVVTQASPRTLPSLAMMRTR